MSDQPTAEPLYIRIGEWAGDWLPGFIAWPIALVGCIIFWPLALLLMPPNRFIKFVEKK